MKEKIRTAKKQREVDMIKAEKVKINLQEQSKVLEE
jgi:hypothetical protein